MGYRRGLTGNQVSDTTLRGRRNEWVAAGVFDALVAEALAAYDRIIGANRHDSILVPATLEAVGARGLLGDIETLHLDRGYDSAVVRDLVAASGIDDLICAKRRPAGAAFDSFTQKTIERFRISRSTSSSPTPPPCGADP